MLRTCDPHMPSYASSRGDRKSSHNLAAALVVAAMMTILLTGAALADFSTAPGQQPPLDITPPSITGTAQVGGTLTSDAGTWSGYGLKYSYQWLRCGEKGMSCNGIPEATATTYQLERADVGTTLRVVLTTSNQHGSAAATSAA